MISTQIHGPICHTHGIRGFGDPSWGVMSVGISPRADEIKSGRPDTGRAGQLMDAIFESVQWPSTQVYHTNSICYECPEPSPEQLAACLPRLSEEILLYRPKLIICFGAVPAEQLIPVKKPKRGYLYHSELPYPHYKMYVYHPASVFNDNAFVYDISRDLSKINYILETDPAAAPKPEVYIVQSHEEAQYILSNLSGSCALDIETKMRDPNDDTGDIHSDDLLCLAISTSRLNDPVYVFPRECLDNLVWPATHQVKWIFQNGPFDTSGLRKYLGVHLIISEDTMYMSYAGDEYSGTFNLPRKGQNKLETLTAEYFGDVNYKEATKRAWSKHIQPPAHDLYTRNALDAHYTRLLVPVLRELRPPCPAYESLLLPAAMVFSEITERGAYIDSTASNKLLEDWLPIYLRLWMSIKEHVTNPKSRLQLQKYLFGTTEDGALGLTPTVFTPTGAPKTSKDVLRAILETAEFPIPFVSDLLDLNQYTYLLQNWVVGIKKHVKIDGRIHPNVLLHGPETGRRAYHDPAVQTIPKHGQNLQRIRSLFAATTDDYVIIEADYTQIEVWVGAYMANDPNLLHDLQSGDVHAATAKRLGLDPTNKEHRQAGKTINFLVQYGGGAGKAQSTLLSRGIEYSYAECALLIDKWRLAYPRYWAWTEEIWHQIQTEGVLTSPFGRMRRCPLVTDPSWRSQFINWPVQSTAGDYVLSSIIELHPLLKPLDSYVLFDVHDSLVAEVSKKHLQEAIHLIKSIMEAPKAGMPGVKVEVTVGPNLLDQKPWRG